MVPVRIALVTLAVTVSSSFADSGRLETSTDPFGFIPGSPIQTPSSTKPSQCTDSCFTEAATGAGCSDLNDTSCICSNIGFSLFSSQALLCVERSCGLEQSANIAQYFRELCGEPGNLPPGQSTGLFPSIPASESTLIGFSSSATGGGHGVGTESTRIVPTATAAPTTVTVTDNASKGVSTIIPSPVDGNSVKAGDGVSTAAPASDAQDASGTGDAVTQTVTDDLSSNTSAPGVNSHINAGARVQRRTAAGFVLAGLCGFLGIASVL